MNGKKKIYKLARIHKKDRWFVYYNYLVPEFAHLPLGHSKHRFKIYGELNSIKNITERKREAELIRDSVNELLRAGWSPLELPQPQLRAELDIPVDMAETVAELEKVYIKQYSGTTADSYRKAMAVFQKHLATYFPGVLGLQHVQRYHVMHFLDTLLKSGLSPVTRNGHLTAIRTYYRDFLARGLVTENPCTGVPWLKVKKQAFQLISEEQLKIIRDYYLEHEPMMWIFCQFILYDYIRPKELRELRVNMIDQDNGVIRIKSQQAKNGKEQPVFVPDFFMAEIKAYLKGSQANDYVFTADKKAGPVKCGENYANKRWREMREATGLPEELKLYGLKPTGGIIAAKSGIDVIYLKDQFRHKSLDQTYGYIGRYHNLEGKKKLLEKLNSWEDDFAQVAPAAEPLAELYDALASCKDPKLKGLLEMRLKHLNEEIRLLAGDQLQPVS